MNIKDMMKIKSLQRAKLIAGQDGILNKIYGVNVLEAIDIENWGQPGEVILTSFFALHNLSDNELDQFFQKLRAIGTSAIIIKIDRLVQQIPAHIIGLCNKHSIPLVQIGKEVKYEGIILEILGPIINKNVNLLNKYYEVHSELTSLALKMPSTEEILREFKKMIQREVSLINLLKGTEVSTNPRLCHITPLSTRAISPEKYMHFNYERKKVIYHGASPEMIGQQIRVRIPYLGYEDYELVIHELLDEINAEDFMIIENAVKFLQMELLKKYMISQNKFQQKNSITNDLLNDRLYEEKDIDEVLESLDIHNHRYYQVILVALHQQDENKKPDKNRMLQILRQVRCRFIASFKKIAFMENLDRIAFIINYDDLQYGPNTTQIVKIMNDMVEDQLFNGLHYYVSISSRVEKLGIPKANREVLDTQKVLRLFHDGNKILPYEELGIYKLFLESNSLGNLEKFISPRINAFRLDYPQLFETLKTFLDTNQSYSLTSEKLFLHPKTVRYRIDKIKELLDIDFKNQEEVLQIQVTARLLKLMEGRKKS